MRMYLKLENPRLFSDIVSIISEVVAEVRLKIDKDNVSLTAVDPANIAMVHFKMPGDLFSEYKVESEQVLGVNLENLKAVLRRCKPGSSLIIERADNFLKLGIQDRIKRDFSLALIEIDSEERKLPEWEFNSVIKIN